MASPGRPRRSSALDDRGARLRAALRQARSSQFRELSDEDFARHVGMSVNTWRKLERSTVNPGFFTVVDLARVLGLDLTDLVATTDGGSSP